MTKITWCSFRVADRVKKLGTDYVPIRAIPGKPRSAWREGRVGVRCRLLLRVSDAGRSQRCGLHRGRRPKAFNEGTRGKLQAVAPRAPSAMEVCAPRSCVKATDADECVG